ncbi:MAG: DNA polymerase Y family protein [Proteobacteria bacterium]|nr:DNA polymerase Y family protein [Pseudomonadota bacterium]MBS0493350.1 DNA polymerase Y family protein [Pseudomonadota bacterium]
MQWVALSLSTPSDETPPSSDALAGLATWALQFTPRVATVDEAIVLELESSLRLFGGRKALHERLRQEAPQLGCSTMAWAPNSLAALACARAGVLNGLRQSLPQLLDALPMETLSATTAHRVTLAQLGCRTLGDVRRLPRGGISRRFGKELLAALDQAYGLRPEAHEWIELPTVFRARLELMTRVETAPALLFGARRLLLQLCGWLAARNAGITAFTLHWAHDAMRARDAGEGGMLTIRTAQPMRNVEHLCRLLAEHLAHAELQAPVGDLTLAADEVLPLQERSASLLPDSGSDGESLALVLERVAARLGPERVLRPVLVEDHRAEWAQHWQPAAQPLPRQRVAPPQVPQPSFVLPEPLRLLVRGHRPLYQGPLLLLAGPHRVEGGWWHREDGTASQGSHHVVRDYWVALSEHAGVLWVFQQRLAGDDIAWYLQGWFA